MGSTGRRFRPLPGSASIRRLDQPTRLGSLPQARIATRSLSLALVEDFYAEIQRHPAASRVITGGHAQIDRLKQTLRQWLSELFAGPYDEHYVARRWRVGLRHVEIGLPQVYTAAAMSRLRNGMIRVFASHWKDDEADSVADPAIAEQAARTSIWRSSATPTKRTTSAGSRKPSASA